MQKKRILFISRKYPPSLGGMQYYSRNLLDNLRAFYEVDAILLGRSQLHLVWFLPFCLFKAVILSLKNKYDILYISDALLAPLGLIIKRLSGAKLIITVHGLDITYKKFFYQRIIPPAVAKSDRVVCVSQNTLKECVARKVSSGICEVIPNGVRMDEYYLGADRPEYLGRLNKEAGCNLKNKKIILTAGRLVKRKGVDWFIENVFIKLSDDFVYLISGGGPLKNRIEGIIKRLSLEGRVILLGQVGYSRLQLLYNCADVFVMPNQKISDDPEGFGIVAIEAASCGTPVVANNIDGLSEAVIEEKTGWLIKYNDADAFMEKVKNPNLDREEVRANARVFSWASLVEQYRGIID